MKIMSNTRIRTALMVIAGDMGKIWMATTVRMIRRKNPPTILTNGPIYRNNSPVVESNPLIGV